MSIFEITYPMYSGRRNAKCRACQHFGKDPENSDLYSEECQDKSAPIRNRMRDHNSPACSHFQLADWLKPGD